MRIDRVQSFPVRYPEPNNDNKMRSLTLVRIETSDGLVGWGEAITGAETTSLAVAFVVERRLAPLVVGEDPRQVREIWQRMLDATYWDGNGGLVTFGISAIDMALWDLAGKASGQPLYELLGGGSRTRHVRACASTILATDDMDRIARDFAGYVEQGYSCVKGGWGHDLSIAFGRDEWRDRAIAATVREAIGPDVDMILDVVALAGWTADHAIKMARALHDDVRLLWLEDPLSEQELEGYRRLHEAVDVPICTGEKGWHEQHYRSLMAAGALDVVMIDPGKAEGITGTWNVVQLAAAAGVAWNAHSWSSALNTAASLHLAVASDNVLLLELKPLPSPMQHDLVEQPIEQRDGRVEAPAGAGLGVTVIEAAVREYSFTEERQRRR